MCNDPPCLKHPSQIDHETHLGFHWRGNVGFSDPASVLPLPNTERIYFGLTVLTLKEKKKRRIIQQQLLKIINERPQTNISFISHRIVYIYCKRGDFLKQFFHSPL